MLVKPVLECVRRWCSHDVFRKGVPVWYYSLAEEQLSDVQSGSFDGDLHNVYSQIVDIV